MGWLDQASTPTPKEIDQALSGRSINVSGGIVSGVGESLSFNGGSLVPTYAATEVGIFTPQVGVSYHYSETNGYNVHNLINNVVTTVNNVVNTGKQAINKVYEWVSNL